MVSAQDSQSDGQGFEFRSGHLQHLLQDLLDLFSFVLNSNSLSNSCKAPTGYLPPVKVSILLLNLVCLFFKYYLNIVPLK